jgi:tetratricopeptide (TPR) repeat protein
LFKRSCIVEICRDYNRVPMPKPSASMSIEPELRRVRDLSMRGQHQEALAAAAALVFAAPENREVLYLVAANQRCLNQLGEALVTLRNLEQHHPRFSLLYQERGHCYTALRDAPHAIEAFLRAVHLNPALAKSWSMLERLYRMSGEEKSAAAAAERLSAIQQLPQEVVRAGSLFSDGDLAAAENILRGFLHNAGEHAEALRLLGRIRQQRGALHEAEQLLEAAVKLEPNYRAARLDHLRVLLERQKYPRAEDELEKMAEQEAADRDYLSLKAAAWAGLGKHEEAIVLYRKLLASSESPELHVVLGHSLQSLGRRNEAIECYQAAMAKRWNFGDAYWSLANLKTYRFSTEETVSMRAAESAATTEPADRYHLCFALGKAYEDRGEYSESWEFYERGNGLKRAENRYAAEGPEGNTRKQMEVCTAEFFAARRGAGAPERDPIFIVGLPRSGSTLVEQILASHSQVEGTQELYDVPRIAVEMQGSGAEAGEPRYPAVLAELVPEDFRRLGQRYLTETRPYRTGKPRFIDKMPNNFRHLGLIHLMLPNATIVDVRREPMACCFSNLKQLFARGQEFSYDMKDMARYYRSYLDLMQHWNEALPGRVRRVCYEELVEDLEGNVRRILEFCGLEFEAACAEFYKTERSVRTPSSEQVRQPIFREALNQWKNYDRWLGPLKDALGDALMRYRE